MPTPILIIDDDTELCALLAEFLATEGFAADAVHNGSEALEHCKNHHYSAIVLDIMLPGMQGLDVLRHLRSFSNTPVLMLTAKGEDTDRILGLELGADDYLPKPCNPRELSARLRAILRRTDVSPAAVHPPTTITAGGITADAANRVAKVHGEALNLTSAEFNVLRILLSNSGQAVAKESLSEQALGRALSAYDRSIDVHISNLRKKLSAKGAPNLILSVRGVGYQFTPGPPEENHDSRD